MDSHHHRDIQDLFPHFPCAYVELQGSHPKLQAEICTKTIRNKRGKKNKKTEIQGRSFPHKNGRPEVF